MSEAFKVPELGEGVKSATVARLLITVGEEIQLDQPVVELETDKAALEVPSGVEGTVDAVLVKAGDEVKVGQTLFTVSAGDGKAKRKSQEPEVGPEVRPEIAQPARESAASKISSPSPEPAKPAEPAVAATHPTPAAPSVRRLARELGVDLGAVKGSGPNGRINMEDVRVSARLPGTAGASGATTGGPAGETPLPDFSPWGAVERAPMSRVRRLTAERMSRAWTLIPHVTEFGKADVTEIEALRTRYKADAERVGGHLTLTVVLLKTVAGALKTFPGFNASVDMARLEIVRRRYCNVGIAVDTERGLVVPVVRGVDGKNLIELSVELSGITVRAREGKLAVDELQGGCFTITNEGALGGVFSTPIINWPEVAILGLGRTRTEAVYREGEFKPRLMLPLSLSYDHRAIDGADAVRFLKWIIEALEEPVKLLWEG